MHRAIQKIKCLQEWLVIGQEGPIREQLQRHQGSTPLQILKRKDNPHPLSRFLTMTTQKWLALTLEIWNLKYHHNFTKDNSFKAASRKRVMIIFSSSPMLTYQVDSISIRVSYWMLEDYKAAINSVFKIYHHQQRVQTAVFSLKTIERAIAQRVKFNL